MKVLSLFSGIGAFEVALNKLNIEWELDHYCEIDKFACQSYNCIHGTTDKDNLKDVTNIDYSKIGDIDLVTYGFPCQDISLAGNQKGFFDEDGNLTRSGLFFNAADVIRHTNPKFAIFENVKNLTGKKFKAEFETVLSTLDELGYNTYWKVLNAKDYGIPQNRERVFGISIRKDIDHGYTFPLPIKLTLRLKNILEKEVDEKYYLSEKMFNYAFNIEKDAKGVGFSDAVDKSFINPNVSNTLSTKSLGGHSQRSGTSTYVCEPYDKCIRVSELKETIEKNNGELGEGLDLYNRRVINDGIAKTLGANCGNNGTAGNMMVYKDFRIRKLTPLECWRLMGFDDEYFYKAEKVNSNTQLYKQAGNSIVVSVIEAIFESLAIQYPSDFVQRWGEDL